MNLSQGIIENCWLNGKLISFYDAWLDQNKPVFIPLDVLVTSILSLNLIHWLLVHNVKSYSTGFLYTSTSTLFFWVKLFNSIAPVRFLSSRVVDSNLSMMYSFQKIYYMCTFNISSLYSCFVQIRKGCLSFTSVSEICFSKMAIIEQFTFLLSTYWNKYINLPCQ